MNSINNITEAILTKVNTECSSIVRMQQLVFVLRHHFGCDAIGLLRLEHGSLKPVAMLGLAREAMGRRFVVASHPRLAAILASKKVVRFEPDSPLPDPYDGLLEHQPGQALPVHECMGISLYVEGRCWGVLTLDGLEKSRFGEREIQELNYVRLLVETSLRFSELEQKNQELQFNYPVDENAALAVTSPNYEIIGQSEALEQTLQELNVVAGSELPVLLLGETGVGKELFAHKLHRSSTRANQPMVYINCAALPESLAESELFGHSKGAFSGASTERAGRFEAADGGTLFLDEVGELPLSIQAKLLRVLQNGEIQRLGSDQMRKVDVRLVAATNRDLKQQVKQGEFRADLYHRLSVYPLPIPPLRHRKSDIPLLAGHFLELNRSRLGVRSLRLSKEAELALLDYHWPGNVRELEHVISRAAIKVLSQGVDRADIVTIYSNLLDIDTVMASPATSTATPFALPALAELDDEHPLSLKDAVAQLQRYLINRTLTKHQGRWAAAARELEVDPSNLHKLAQRLGLK